MPIELSEPRTAAELDAYYELRWRELRDPWDQPRGSERDELEDVARHIAARDESGDVIGVGRIHWLDDGAAQIRYMATAHTHRRRGIGRTVIARLEEIALDAGAQRIVINARQPAVPFYEKLGYEITGDSILLFGVIPHKWMQKRLA
jgi:GNAT superfamily N-acetyltransferase